MQDLLCVYSNPYSFFNGKTLLKSCFIDRDNVLTHLIIPRHRKIPLGFITVGDVEVYFSITV